MDSPSGDAKVEIPPAGESEGAKIVYESEMTTPVGNPERLAVIRHAFLGMFLFLIPTLLQAVPLSFIKAVRIYFQSHSQIIYVFLILYAMSTVAFALAPSISLKSSFSWISGIFMVESLTLIVAMVSTNYDCRITLYALSGTIIICLLLAIPGLYCKTKCNMKKANKIIFILGLLVLIIGLFVYILEIFVACYPANTVFLCMALFCMCIYYFHALQGLNNVEEMEDESDKNIIGAYLYTNFTAIFLLCESLFATFNMLYI